MCEAGRIKHHLKHNLWKPENTILFVGYQASNNLGRSLINGAKKVKLFGETVSVAAHITQLPGVSGHADVNGLLDWAKAVSGVKMFFINHGDDRSVKAFGERLRSELGTNVYEPYSGAEFDIAAGVVTVDAEPVLIPKKKAAANISEAYGSLTAASDRLAALVRAADGCANADLRKLAEAINKLCDKWES